MEPGDVILISDEEDDCAGPAGDSVVIVEPGAEHDQEEEEATTSEVVDDDLLVTFSRKATVMPHARYDCDSNAFSPTEDDTRSPLENNAAFCDQCFCYVCDKLVSQCQVWKAPGICHCNAHKRSEFWKSQRNKAVLGYLHVFNFDLLEVDTCLRLAENHLQMFEASLAMEYHAFLAGTHTLFSCDCRCHTASQETAECMQCSSRHVRQVVYNYSKVFQRASEFLSRAEREEPKARAVMMLGAAKMFVSHALPPGAASVSDPEGSVINAVSLLLTRVTNTLRTLMVTAEFSNSFSKKLCDFFQSLPLPVTCRWLMKSLKVLPWDNPLLVAVLRGQNITGERHLKGKKEVLLEPVPVVQMRVEKLMEQSRYRELARYLRVVRTDDKTQLLSLKDRVPLHLCQAGELGAALASFFSHVTDACCPACRLTPAQFVVYLLILATGRVPVGRDPFLSTQWESIKDVKVPKKPEVIRWALRVLNCNTVVFLDPKSWVDLIKVACMEAVAPNGTVICASYQMPDVTFLMFARVTAASVLLEESSTDIQIPKIFLHQYPGQAPLILVTQALIHRVFHCPMVTVLGVVMSFKDNSWALQWFYHGLSSKPEVLQAFLSTLLNDLYRDSRKLELLDHRFIADFLAYCLKDPRPPLCPVIQHILDDLLQHWNGRGFPWQFHMRIILQHSRDHSSEIRRFLDITQGLF